MVYRTKSTHAKLFAEVSILIDSVSIGNKDRLTFFIGGGYVLRQSKERSCESLSPFSPRKMGGCLRTLAFTPGST